MKPKKTNGPRNTRAQLIREQPNDAFKFLIAEFGFLPTKLTFLAWCMFFWRERANQEDHLTTPLAHVRLWTLRTHAERNLGIELHNAVCNRDGAALRELADYLESPKKESADKTRSKAAMFAIFIRTNSDLLPKIEGGWRMEPKEFARITGYKGPLETLRRTLKEMGFPLLERPRGRPNPKFARELTLSWEDGSLSRGSPENKSANKGGNPASKPY